MKRRSPEEISKLKSMAQDYPAAKIAEALGRGRSATIVKAHLLKVSLRLKGPSDPAIRAESSAPRLPQILQIGCADSQKG
jgi:hypothetical protein